MVKKNVKRGIIIGGIVVGVILIISIGLVTSFLSQNSAYKIASGAMEPILKVNDSVIVDKTIPFDELEIDDIIVFLRPSGHDRTIIMRIVDFSS